MDNTVIIDVEQLWNKYQMMTDLMSTIPAFLVKLSKQRLDDETQKILNEWCLEISQKVNEINAIELEKKDQTDAETKN